MSSREVAKLRPHPGSLSAFRVLPWLSGWPRCHLSLWANCTSLAAVCLVTSPAFVWLISTVKFWIPLLPHRHPCPDSVKPALPWHVVTQGLGWPRPEAWAQGRGGGWVESQRQASLSRITLCVSLPVGSFKLFSCASIITVLPYPEKLLSWETLEPGSKITD